MTFSYRQPCFFRIFKGLLTFSLALCIGQQAVAVPSEASARDISTLTLDELIDFASQHNALYQAAKANMEIARAELITAGLFPNPQFLYQQAFIGGAPNSEAGSTEYAPGLSWEIDWAGKRGLREKVAQKGLHAERLHFTNFDRLFKKEIRQTYRTYLLLAELKQLKKEFLTQYEALLERSKIRAKSGDISGLEYDRLELERIFYETDFRSTELQFLQVCQQLRRFLGLSPSEEPLILAGKLVFIPLDELKVPSKTFSPDKRPDLLALQARADQAQSEEILKRREVLPSLNLGTEYRKKGTEGYFGISASIPLPIFNRNQGEILRSEETASKYRFEAEARRLEISSEIALQISSLKTREETLKNYEKMGLLKKNKLVAERSRFAYLKKAFPFVAFLESQRNYLAVLKNYLEQLHLYYISIDELAAATAEVGENVAN